MQSIELLLDSDSDQAVRASWDALAGAGLPSLANHTGASNAPHVTLLAAADGRLDPALGPVRDALRGLDLVVEIGAIVLFGGHRDRWVLARQIVVTEALLTLHTAVHAAVGIHAPDVRADPLSAPGAWTPHVTLTRRLPAADLPRALAILATAPIPSRLTCARLWDSAPKTVTPLA